MSLYLKALRSYTSWSGRADRKEYWTFTLVNLVLLIAVEAIGMAAGGTALPAAILALVLLPPSLAVLARRLHDTGRSAWWILFGFVPVVGSLTLFVFTLLPGNAGGDRFGGVAYGIPA